MRDRESNEIYREQQYIERAARDRKQQEIEKATGDRVSSER
jgi:hypothetical protein